MFEVLWKAVWKVNVLGKNLFSMLFREETMASNALADRASNVPVLKQFDLFVRKWNGILQLVLVLGMLWLMWMFNGFANGVLKQSALFIPVSDYCARNKTSTQVFITSQFTKTTCWDPVADQWNPSDPNSIMTQCWMMNSDVVCAKLNVSSLFAMLNHTNQ